MSDIIDKAFDKIDLKKQSKLSQRNGIMYLKRNRYDTI